MSRKSIFISIPAIKNKVITLLLFVFSAGITVITFRELTNHDYVFGLIPMFDVDKESNIPTYLQGIFMLFCSLLLFTIAKYKSITEEVFIKHWYFLAAMFTYLSIDELVGIHELLILPLRTATDAKGIFYFSWLIAFIPIVLMIGGSYIRFLLHLNSKTRNLFIIAASFFLGGAIGMEMIGGAYLSEFGEKNYVYSIITLIEESFETIGITIFIFTLLDYQSSLKLNIALYNDSEHLQR